MPTLVHEYDWPDRVVIGTVGRPGDRAFYLQARTGARCTSVLLEKQQSAALADGIQQLLDHLMTEGGNPFGIPGEAPAGLADVDPLDQPVETEFRAGTIRLSWDPRTAQTVVEVFPVEEERPDDEPDLWDDPADEPEPDDEREVLVVRMPVGTARAFVERTRTVVRSGRPPCPLCGAPVDPDGHECDLP
ncbi:putative repeat protein (TIGR03847 family) [Sediminihabitans luteus]|uniref:Putative repeat protein (TIGR03847 family) n=1 Tax=Sediminihabitans luteus TaxID=1138585 RepID=A0A2M9CC53_9CELL|nr:DUF3090 domain-containing protein [Sediminihabitans luteus]PJJ68654.1 putative repeat protein (TIGR03847 family) [Sediminihabitans luteus]GII99994.1 hypothetical protein Slu03_23720 [Sediminihabitans luteus]